MMKKIISGIMSAVLGLSSFAMMAQTGETIFSYYDTELNSQIAGLGLNGCGDGEYHLAMQIPADLAGSKIKSLIVPFGDIRGYSGFSAWVSKSLPNSFVPDVVSKTFTPKEAEGENSATRTEVVFDEPVTVPEGGVYVGYSFTIDNGTAAKYQNQNGILGTIKAGIDQVGDIFMVRYKGTGSYSQQNYNWLELGGYYFLCLQAKLEVPEKGLSVSAGAAPIRVIGAADNKYTVTLTNVGSKGASGFDYVLKVGDKTTEGSYTFPSSSKMSREGYFGKRATYDVPLGQFSENGIYDFSFEVTKVDGVENTCAKKSSDNKVMAYADVPEHNPVIEESTCTKCGFCTMGFYGLEVMNRLYPDVIAISYHNKWQGADPMAVMDPPFPAGGNPAAFVDRVTQVSFAGNERTATMEKPWLERKEAIAPASMEVAAEWVDDTQEAIDVTATAKFILPEENAKYRLDFALLHDDMNGRESSWAQTNYYGGGMYGHFPEPEWDKFRNETTVRGLHYNDIFILGGTRDMGGILATVPSTLEAGQEVKYTHRFVLANAVNTDRANLVQDKTKLRVVALLLDSTTGEIVNAAKGLVPGYVAPVSGVEGIATEGATPVAYYNMNGMEVKNPENGIYIVRLSNGKTEKVVINK